MQETQKKINQYKTKYEDALKAIAINMDRQEKSEKELKEVVSRKNKLDEASSHAQVAQKRLNTVNECIRVVTELYEALSLSTKDQLSKRVNDTFRSILNKDYWVEIDDDYRLNVFKANAGGEKIPVYEKSSGESQVTSLSFIGGIVSLARDKQSDSGKFFRGGVFPIVMDSPFGILDPGYRELVARVRLQRKLELFSLRLRDCAGPFVNVKRPLSCGASASFWPVSSV